MAAQTALLLRLILKNTCEESRPVRPQVQKNLSALRTECGYGTWNELCKVKGRVREAAVLHRHQAGAFPCVCRGLFCFLDAVSLRTSVSAKGNRFPL